MDSTTSPLKRKRESPETLEQTILSYRKKLKTIEGLSYLIDNFRVLLNSSDYSEWQTYLLDSLLKFSELKFELRRKEREEQQQKPL